ncbi:SDR family oxidoreductase [Pseudonocardia sp. C8]|uniref:SDR family oxidoreductase n=1 Tax=Pseudonocardia sp. C8 TaxID=2762759 RepID=UPI00164324A9|nr:SDR family oxidoreductase [Pseudonocardia sp. C8]MBC3191739.1 SDR family oxidoreductase [Pseudonocardia sp. C8]
MDLELAGRTVLVTGASRGIGECVARAFAAEGSRLKLVARSEDALDRVARDLRTEIGAQVEFRALDLASPDAVEHVVEFAGEIDVLVNNAGDIPGGDLWQVDESAWRRGWDLKVFGYINLTRAFLAQMRDRRSGVILNNIGSSGENLDFDYVAGSTGNAALMAFTRAVGGRSLDMGVRVLGVNPGPVATERIFRVLRTRTTDRGEPQDEIAGMIANYPGARMATAEEVADMFVFLASPRSGYTSGTIVTLDGGGTSRRSIG